ncbi:MAG: efflux RND transporter periplasmic adaptor subunit [Hyphomicrobium aestuarii]|nr:efflux RND transporter periplasmic adaptor subunit [Hyphomicrobium aestuarii]
MLGLNSTSLFALAAAAVVAAALLASPAQTQSPATAPTATAPTAASPGTAETGPGASAKPQWIASATGRVEPRNGNLTISTPVAGRTADVAVSANDVVRAGDLLVRLEDEDQLIRAAAAKTDVQVRERERDEEPVRGLALERRQAEDSVSTAERALFRARLAFDAKALAARVAQAPAGSTAPAGSSAPAASKDLDQARFEINAAKEQLANSRANLQRVQSRDGMPLATRLESSLATARAELSIAEAAVERARIRAPADGTILGVYIKYGELASPSPEAPMIVMGDLSGLRVKAEVEERDAPKVKVGQRVVIKGDAFPDKEFTGIVTSVSQAMAAPRIPPRGVRRPTDIEVAEVVVVLDGLPPLLTGMRVDVFFKPEQSATAGTRQQPAAVGASAAKRTTAN